MVTTPRSRNLVEHHQVHCKRPWRWFVPWPWHGFLYVSRIVDSVWLILSPKMEHKLGYTNSIQFILSIISDTLWLCHKLGTWWFTWFTINSFGRAMVVLCSDKAICVSNIFRTCDHGSNPGLLLSPYIWLMWTFTKTLPGVPRCFAKQCQRLPNDFKSPLPSKVRMRPTRWSLMNLESIWINTNTWVTSIGWQDSAQEHPGPHPGSGMAAIAREDVATCQYSASKGELPIG